MLLRRLLIGLLALSLFLAPTVEAAVVYQGNTAKGNAANSTGWTQAVTVPATSTFLMLFVQNADSAAADRVVTGASIGGQAMTQYLNGSTSTASISGWYIANPPTGSQTVSTTFAGTNTDTGGIIIYLNGVNLTNPIARSSTMLYTATTIVSTSTNAVASGSMMFVSISADLNQRATSTLTAYEEEIQDVGATGWTGVTKKSTSTMAAAGSLWLSSSTFGTSDNRSAAFVEIAQSTGTPPSSGPVRGQSRWLLGGGISR